MLSASEASPGFFAVLHRTQVLRPHPHAPLPFLAKGQEEDIAESSGWSSESNDTGRVSSEGGGHRG